MCTQSVRRQLKFLINIEINCLKESYEQASHSRKEAGLFRSTLKKA